MISLGFGVSHANMLTFTSLEHLLIPVNIIVVFTTVICGQNFHTVIHTGPLTYLPEILDLEIKFYKIAAKLLN